MTPDNPFRSNNTHSEHPTITRLPSGMSSDDGNPDISRILTDWPYEPGKLTVRLISTPEGDERVQVRLDMGLLQMQLDGRPDGMRPSGFESVLEMVEAEIDDARAGDLPRQSPEHEGEEPAEQARSLTNDQCQALRDESVQYYHRYLALLALEDFERVIRDTTRNLRVLDVVRDHAEEDDDRESLEPYRAYITMVRARALASLALRENEPKAALHAIDEGLEALKKHFEETGRFDLFEDSTEVHMLRSMREALVPKLPVSQKAELNERLKRAIDQENYKLAAILRDELKLIDQPRPEA